MKRTLKPLAKILIALTPVLMLGSCIKKVENSTSAETGTAEIKGRVRAELDNTKSGLEPLGSQTVYVFVDSKAYAQNPGTGTYPLKRFQTKTDVNGDYSLIIDVPLKGVNVTITVPGSIQNVNTGGGLQRTILPETSVSGGNAKDGSVLVEDINISL